MGGDDFLRPPGAAGMARADRAIRDAALLSLALFISAAGGGCFLLPALFDFPTALPERLGFAALANLFLLGWVLYGVAAVAAIRRVSSQDSGGSAAGPPSARLRIHAAFLQNTLEQAVLAGGVYLALAALLDGPWLALIVIAVVFFGAGRILFLRGYAKGARGRALGMTLTLIPTGLGYALAIGLVLLRLLT